MAAVEPLAAPVQILAMACMDAKCDFKPMEMTRRPVGEYDILIDMKYCGVCHTDLHYAAGHTEPALKTKYPCVPGHELAGVVEKVGARVSKFQVGDHIGVGCIVDSCGNCKRCRKGEENQCSKVVWNYFGEDWSGRAAPYPAMRENPDKPGKQQKAPIIGGYSSKCVIHENYAVKIPKDYPLECAGPIMCAGTTMHNPLTIFGAGPGMKVGIAGLGGLGILGIKIAKQMGCIVTALSRSESKKDRALAAGAASYVATSKEDQMDQAKGSLDLILDTIPVRHSAAPYKKLLKAESSAKHVFLGAHPEMLGAMVVDTLLGGRATVGASGLGGIAKTQEIIDLCNAAEPKIVPEVKLMPVHELGKIYEALDGSNDDGLRYVLDLQGTLNEKTKEMCSNPAPKLADQDPSSKFSGSNICGACCKTCCSECSCSCCLHCFTCGAFWSRKKFG